jgi:hypothetical protein
MTVDLSCSEGLVLFELLARFEKSGHLQIEHPTEERVLAKARTDVCARWGG